MITYYDSTTIIDRMWYKDGVRTPLIIQRFTARYQYDYDLQIWTAVFSSNYRCLDPTYINGLISGEKEIVVAGSETINIYPNPFKGKFKISGITKGKNTISIHSVTGKCVYTAEIYNTEIEINLSQLPAGIYIYQMYSDTKMLKSGKLIKN
jgi:hypothetical protein